MIGHLVRKKMESIAQEWFPVIDDRIYESLNDIVRDKCEICFIGCASGAARAYDKSRRLYLYRIFLLRFFGDKFDKNVERKRFVVCCGLCMSLLYNEQTKTLLKNDDSEDKFYDVVKRTYWNYHFNVNSRSKIRRQSLMNK